MASIMNLQQQLITIIYAISSYCFSWKVLLSLTDVFPSHQSKEIFRCQQDVELKVEKNLKKKRESWPTPSSGIDASNGVGSNPVRTLTHFFRCINLFLWGKGSYVPGNCKGMFKNSHCWGREALKFPLLRSFARLEFLLSRYQLLGFCS